VRAGVIFASLILVLSGDIATAEPASVAKPMPAALVYKPPLRGAPATRVGGGTRNPETAGLVLYVLAPEHTGLTTREQPTLYWFISKPARARIEITLIDGVSVQPLLETAIEDVAKSGFQSLNLADHGIRLKPGVDYQWSVAVVRNPAQRSSDVVASGGITLQDADTVLQERVAGAAENAKVSIYAESGYWYDALMSLGKRIDADPRNGGLQRMRAELLKQVGLPAFGDTAAE